MATVVGRPHDLRWARNGAVDLAFRVTGDPNGRPLLLLSGNGTQMVHWPPELLDGLIGRGFSVAMLDNRDSGHSTHCAGLGRYDLRDMADDAVAVLDAIGWSSAHLAGVSLGGMIGQVMAVHHADRVRTLTSISSAPAWGFRFSRPRLRTIAAIIGATRRPPRDRDDAADQAVALFRIMGAPGQDLDEPWLREVAAVAFDVDQDRAAGQRQLAACKAGGDRRAELGRVTAPTLVVHGDEDPMQSPAAGRATAAAIPGARLLRLPGAGHVLPASAWAAVLDAVDDLARAPRPV